MVGSFVHSHGDVQSDQSESQSGRVLGPRFFYTLYIFGLRNLVEREDAVLHELERCAGLHNAHAVLAVLQPLVP